MEAYCSGQALERDATELARDKPDSRLADALGSDGRVSGRELVRAAEEGDPDAGLVFDRFGRMLGVAIAGYVNVFEPELVVIGGGLSRASDLFLDRAIKEAATRALPALWRRTEVTLAEGGADAGVIGAGLLAAHEIRQTETAQRNRQTRKANDNQHRQRRSSTSSASTRSGRCRWTRSRRRTPATRAPPMALAPLAYMLFTRVMRHNPANPDWPDRDRFVLSAGHASMLLYSMLYLTGYPLTLDDIKHFRQVGSPTAGHPERKYTPGIEATTGPLGQGLAMAVGMALAERMLAARFNRPGHEIVDHHTFVIASDGDIQEGVASEASLARRATGASAG